MRAQDRTLLASLGFADPDKGDERHYLACKFLAGPQREALLRMMGDKLKELPFYADKYHGHPWWKAFYDRYGGAPSRYGDGDDRLRISHRATGERAYADCKGGIEEPISKGAGQYKTTIGFVDAWASAVRKRPMRITWSGEMLEDEYGKSGWRKLADGDPSTIVERMLASASYLAHGPNELVSFSVDDFYVRPVTVAVEVKIGVVGVDAILRQIALYREHTGHPHNLASATWCVAAPWAMRASDVSILDEHDVRFLRLGPKFDAYVETQRAEAGEEGGDVL